MVSCHYHPQRQGVLEVVMVKSPNYFICERCSNEDSALEAEVREAKGECQECGCEADDFTENCDHCDTHLGYLEARYEVAHESRYERLQLTGGN